MGFGLDTVLSGGLNIISGYSANQSNIGMQRETNAANIEMSREQMDFQREMSNTAHQREIADLKAAGLNPNLSAGGNGSSTPSGAMPSLSAPHMNAIDFTQFVPMLQRQEMIDLDKQRVANETKKTDAEIPYTQAKTRLSQKGTIRADLEGEASGVLRDAIKKVKDYFRKAPSPSDAEQSPTMQKKLRDLQLQYSPPSSTPEDRSDFMKGMP